MEPITDESKYIFLRNKRNTNTMCVGDTILDTAAESGIDENWCLIDSQTTCNAFINGKYLSNIRDSPDVKYLCVYATKE